MQEIDRLLEYRRQATAEQVAAGRAWYSEARRFVRSLAREYGVPFHRAAGAVAALSQGASWKANRTLALKLASGATDGLFFGGPRAVAIWRDGRRPLAVLTSPKLRSFYLAIVGRDDAAVVDRWMLRAMGRPDRLRAAEYAQASAIIVAAAERVGEPTAVFQAIVWTVVRGGAD